MCNYCCVYKQIMCTSYVYNTILMCILLAEIVQEYKWQSLGSRFGAVFDVSIFGTWHALSSKTKLFFEVTKEFSKN